MNRTPEGIISEGIFNATERKKKNPYTGRILGETIIEEADKVHARGDTIIERVL